MDPREMETLIQRLVANPHDEEALAYAHHAGTTDPRSYALLLEKVGEHTTDPAYAAHWLSEAANVWSTTIGDAHHAARTLMIAIDKDPTQRVAADRLAELYREKGDQKALVALLERLVKSLTSMLPDRPDVVQQLAALHDELGRLWSEPPLSRPERALENWRRLADLDPQNAYAIYAARELLKSQQQWADAVQYFEMEQALIDDPERKLALYRDEADVRRRAGDGPGSTQVLRNARMVMPDDVALSAEVGTSILERVEDGERVPTEELQESAQLFIALAEMYDGDYGLSYSISALRASPGDDRAMQLADHYAEQLNRQDEIKGQFAGYLQANPNGFMAEKARAKAGSVPPPSPEGGFSPDDRGSEQRGSEQRGQGQATGPSRPSQEIYSSGAPSPSSSKLDPSALRVNGMADEAEVLDASALIEEEPEAPAGADVAGMLAQAQQDVAKGKRTQALAKFREVLAIEPANPEALSWVEEHLRQKRMYADLRDVLLEASRVTSQPPETRKAQLRDIAGLCESQLRDLDTAIQAYKQICQIDRADEQARDQLRRLLERGGRWDDLATLLEQEAMSAPDVEQKISLEKKLAQLQEQKRKDPASAADAWARIAGLSPEDDQAILTAVKLYERAEQLDSAATVIAENASGISDEKARGALLQKLGELRLKLADEAGAGAAFADAARALHQAKLWEQAERAFSAADLPVDAANAIVERAELADGKQRATLFAQASELLLGAGEIDDAILNLEKAAEIDATNEQYAEQLEEQYRSAGREQDLVAFLLARAEKLSDKPQRVAARKAAAEVQRNLGDADGTRASLMLVLDDGEDHEALGQLVEDAAVRGEHKECAELLHRLCAIVKNPEERVSIALREASIYAEELGDPPGAIERYEAIYKHLDARNRVALAAVADLQEREGNLDKAADALERESILAEGADRVEIAQRLARMYEGELQNPEGAIKALEIVHAADPEDFDAISRLQKLCERVGNWERVANLMSVLIEVEGDEEEASRMTRHLAGILHDKLNKGDEALAALEKLADEGDAACRKEYIELGDRLGWAGVVATKLVAWNESNPGPERNDALRGAFDRFLEIGREEDAAKVAMELARSKAGDEGLGEKLEQVATRIKDVDALSVAHDILASELSGPARATEMVRQAEVQVKAGVDPLEAMQHGESALTSVQPADVEPLLERLSALTEAPGHVIDLYERQVGRCRLPPDRLAALARAAQVAAARGANDRARSFFELALSGGVQEDTLLAVEKAAHIGDERSGGSALRTILAEALAAGGQGSRDGGRTRAALLRRAASIAYNDLRDIDRAFGWLGDALITHVDDPSLEALHELGRQVNDMFRVEQTLGRALEEVFDGPLVRKLLSHRARLRRDVLGDRKGASYDLKKLHDLSPSDQEVMNELSQLLQELGDHRGMIQLYEDQILRGRDPSQRAELARKVARLWEEEIGDARESADAWRRVLRMKAGDSEATQGLDRAKGGKLKRKPPPPKVPMGSDPPSFGAVPSSQSFNSRPPLSSPDTSETDASGIDRIADSERLDADSVSDDSVSDDSVSDDSVSDDSVSDDSVSDDSVSDDSVSGDSVSGDSVSGDSVSGDSVSDDSVSGDRVHSASGDAGVSDAAARSGDAGDLGEASLDSAAAHAEANHSKSEDADVESALAPLFEGHVAPSEPIEPSIAQLHDDGDNTADHLPPGFERDTDAPPPNQANGEGSLPSGAPDFPSGSGFPPVPQYVAPAAPAYPQPPAPAPYPSSPGFAESDPQSYSDAQSYSGADSYPGAGPYPDVPGRIVSDPGVAPPHPELAPQAEYYEPEVEDLEEIDEIEEVDDAELIEDDETNTPD